ncbi:MAG: hypothetical protein A2902_05955 [Elusimicrobia bacterium RIFCSPLOWO2_01_FULL_64_13]|nr:MAG: hypothetical protein A2902_05955 [Elusimicrobia bacterium RIFCSPLOWO2_01_FULL_64_13]
MPREDFIPKRSRETSRRFRGFWTGLFAMVSCLLVLVSLTVRSTQISYRIDAVKEEIRKEDLRNMELREARDRMISLEAIERSARKSLGLIDPAKDNIVILP